MTRYFDDPSDHHDAFIEHEMDKYMADFDDSDDDTCNCCGESWDPEDLDEGICPDCEHDL